MPIDENEWNKKGRFEEDKEKVYGFLKQNYPNAFDLVEICENMKLDWAYLGGILNH